MSTELKVIAAVVGLILLTTVVLVIVLLVRLVRARKLLRDAGVPLENKLAFWGALLYVISPVDLLPDPILLDDIGVLLLALRSLHNAKDAAGAAGRAAPPQIVRR
ncbi:YkvA family protein [Streptomyces sp. E11-3]|uniref:YkvA family protein n=1 Tax=Streptomyces sp. E11-3 TaxID=3110112 RepID=UPI00397FB382